PNPGRGADPPCTGVAHDHDQVGNPDGPPAYMLHPCLVVDHDEPVIPAEQRHGCFEEIIGKTVTPGPLGQPHCHEVKSMFLDDSLPEPELHVISPGHPGRYTLLE